MTTPAVARMRDLLPNVDRAGWPFRTCCGSHAGSVAPEPGRRRTRAGRVGPDSIHRGTCRRGIVAAVDGGRPVLRGRGRL